MSAFKQVQTAQPLKVQVQWMWYSLLDNIQDTAQKWKRDVDRKQKVVKGRLRILKVYEVFKNFFIYMSYFSSL